MTYAKLLLENFIDNHNSSYYFTTHIKGQIQKYFVRIWNLCRYR